jgi:tetratricopeptide (TPR) repeat protein
MILALALLLQADFTELYRKAYEDRLRAKHPKTEESAVDLALYLAGRGEFGQAAPFFELALASPDADATVLHNWGAGIEQQAPEQAERLYRRALAIREKTLPGGDAELAATRLNLAGLLVARGDGKGAEPLARSALAALERSPRPDNGRIGIACGTLGAALAIRGDVVGAERYFRRALTIAGKAHGPRSEETASALENLADLLTQTGREAAARPLLDRAKRIRAVHADPVVRKPQPF